MKYLIIILLLLGSCASTKQHTQPKGHSYNCLKMKQKPVKRKQPKKPIWNTDTRVQVIPVIILGATLGVIAYNVSRNTN